MTLSRYRFGTHPVLLLLGLSLAACGLLCLSAPALASATPKAALTSRASFHSTSNPLALLAVQQAVLTPSDQTAGAAFGVSVALSGDTALVGAYAEAVGDATPGAAYVFTRSGTVWSQQAELSDPDPVGHDDFGISVALSGDTALVGAEGAAFVFTRSGTSWSEQAELTASDGAAGDGFGTFGSAALSGDTALVGAAGKTVGGQSDAGAAYVFTRSGTSWSQRAEFMDPDATANDEFGSSLAISGDTVLVGAPGKTRAGQSYVGTAYVYSGSGQSWTQQAELSDPDPATNDYFGWSVALSGDTALVGADGKTVGGQPYIGAAYVYIGSGATWTEQSELTPSDAATEDGFGSSVAISSNTVLVGAGSETIGDADFAGAAYVFSGSGASWTQQAKLAAPEPAYEGDFSSSVSLSDGTALIGEPRYSAGNVFFGDAYVELLTSPPVNTTRPAVSGATGVGQRLSCSTGTWTGDPTAFKYRWLRDGVMITGAQKSSYTVATADQGRQLSCRVIASNAAGTTSVISNAVLVPTAPVAPANTVVPMVSGTLAVGQSLSCSTGAWTGDPTPTYSYQWLRDGLTIGGATQNSYTVQSADQGHGLSCLVTAQNTAGTVSVTSNTVSVSAPPGAPVNTVAPVVTGTPKLGATLSCSQGTWSGDPTSFAYQWLRNGVAIEGATSATYTVLPADLGKLLACVVTAQNITATVSAFTNAVHVPALQPAVRLKATPLSLKVGKSITFRGVVKNFLAAKTVCICRRAHGKLTLLRKLTMTSSGHFRWVRKAKKAGTWVFVATYRVGGVTYRSKAVTARVHAA